MNTKSRKKKGLNPLESEVVVALLLFTTFGLDRTTNFSWFMQFSQDAIFKAARNQSKKNGAGKNVEECLRFDYYESLIISKVFCNVVGGGRIFLNNFFNSFFQTIENNLHELMFFSIFKGILKEYFYHFSYRFLYFIYVLFDATHHVCRVAIATGLTHSVRIDLMCSYICLQDVWCLFNLCLLNASGKHRNFHCSIAKTTISPPTNS